MVYYDVEATLFEFFEESQCLRLLDGAVVSSLLGWRASPVFLSSESGG